MVWIFKKLRKTFWKNSLNIFTSKSEGAGRLSVALAFWKRGARVGVWASQKFRFS